MKKLTIEADVDSLDEVLQFVNKELNEISCDRRTIFETDVAVEEIFVNIANYAYGDKTGTVDVEMSADRKRREVQIRLSDSGVRFDPLAKEDPDITLPADKRKIGGLGVLMAKEMTDGISYDYRDGHNILTIIKTY